MREAYCNTSTDLTAWILDLIDFASLKEAEGDDGATTANSTVFTSASSSFSSYGFQKNDTLIIERGQVNEGVYHIEEVTDENTLNVGRKFRATASNLSFFVTSEFRQACERATALIDDEFADISSVIAVPFDRTLLETALDSEMDLDESIPKSQKGYLLDFVLSEVTDFTTPVELTITGYGEKRDWRSSIVYNIEMQYLEDVAEPTGALAQQTETLQFTENGTKRTAKYWRVITKIESNYTTDGTLKVKMVVPERIKQITALTAAIDILTAQYTQATPNVSEWVKHLRDRRDRMIELYRRGVMKLAELTESTVQRGRIRSARIVRT